ncbi:glypican [Synechococcus sp. CS-602]|nr:glypican [Synechococcus sp. SynAce01]MCT0201266.1 glypican [Synechococcus sp. CS-603]MCT0205456.1 glypican [Synechococcus sp. CS-602]MCT0245922.1 glypican [Synechococcus sp. CS-601]TWB89792.1 hypothetical protein FB106_1112 [Synechococcus sp. Ace-Pa]
MARAGLSLRPLPASLALLCAGVGAMVVVGFLTVALLPLLMGAGLLLALLVGAVVFGWAGIEGLAAFERWIENDPRFQR